MLGSLLECVFDGSPANHIVFHRDGGLKGWGLSFADKGSLGSTPSFLLGFNSDEYEGREELLEVGLPGDRMIRAETPKKAKRQAFEQLPADDIARPIRFARRPVEEGPPKTGKAARHQGAPDAQTVPAPSNGGNPGGGAGGLS